MTAPKTKKAKWWQKILLAIGSPLVVFCLAEGIIRLFAVNTDLARNKNFEIAVPVWLLADSNWVHIESGRLQEPRGIKAVDVAWFANFEEARYIQYKLKPRIDVQAINPFNDIEVRKNVTFRIASNKDGFRTREFSPKKKGTFRVVTLGDSSTFGWGVDPEDTWQYLLEKRLKPKYGAAEVFNLGLSGHSTRHGLGVLRHYAWKLDPDLIIISYGANDARFVIRPAEAVLGMDDTWLGGIRWTLLKFRTVQWMRKLIFSAYDPFKEATPKEGAPKGSLVPSVSRDGYKSNLKIMIEEARAKGAAVVLMGVCSPETYVSAMREIASQENVPFVDARRLFLERLSALKEGILYSKELASYKKIYGENAFLKNWWLYVTTDGCHPNRVGTEILAGALADAIESAGFSSSVDD
jgi:lysophospholipase L1-like esterase